MGALAPEGMSNIVSNLPWLIPEYRVPKTTSHPIPAQRLTGNQPSQPSVLLLPSVAEDYFFAAAFFAAIFTGGVRGTAFTALSSTAVSLATGLTAPAGISVVVTVLPSSVPLYTRMRDGSMPFSVTR